MALVKDFVGDDALEAGSTWEWGFNYVRSKVEDGKTVPDPDNPYDLTGCDARMQMRVKITDETALVALSTDEDGGITIGGVDGRVDLLLTDEQTAALYKDQPGKALSGVYDLELVWPAQPGSRRKVKRLLQGSWTVNPGVTRDNDIPPDGVDDE